MKYLKDLLKQIRDHYILTIIIGLFPVSAIIAWAKKVNPITSWVIPFIKWDLSGWAVVVVILIVLTIFKIKKSYFNKGLEKSWVAQAPEFNASYDGKIFERKYANVIWKIIAGTELDPSKYKLSRNFVRAWPAQNPFCPKCDYELERYSNKWFCTPCNISYKIPDNLKDHTWGKIRRIFERDIVQWGHNNFGVSEQPVKPLRVQIEESRQKAEAKSEQN